MKISASVKFITIPAVCGAVVGALFTGSLSFAFSPPTAPPPGGNVSAPLNVSGTGQTKSGGLTLNTGGATYGLIVDKGNVGIGTTGPGAKLHIVQTLASDAFRVDDQAGDTTPFVVNAIGDVGIGVAVPTATLDVNGIMRATIYYDKDDIGYYTNPAGVSLLKEIQTSIFKDYNNVNYYVDPAGSTSALLAGDVGIGTTTPGAKLEVNGQVKITGGSPGAGKVLTSDAAGLATWTTPTSGLGGSGTANYISKWTAGTTLGNSIIYDNGTNVGIGTTGPDRKVVVNVGSAQDGIDIIGTGNTEFRLGNISGGPFGNVIYVSLDQTLRFGTSQAWDVLNIKNGNVGISIPSPAIKLAIGDTDTGLNWVSDGVLQIYTDNVARIHIKNNGDIGIGTTSPGAKLEVAGQVKITGGSPGAGKVLTSDAAGLATWTTPTSGLGGSGTANYVPKWTAGTTLGDSAIYDNGTNVGINTSSPTGKLTVVADYLYNDGSGFRVQSSSGTDRNLLFFSTSLSGNYAAIQSYKDGTGAGVRNLLLNAMGGNVGIGTTSPGPKLDVAGGNVRIWNQSAGQYPSHATLEVNADTRPTIWMESVGENTGGLGILDTNNMVFATERNIQFRTNASFGSGINSGDTRLTILQNGYIGIGTITPTTALVITPTTSGDTASNSAIFIFPMFQPNDINGMSAIRIGGTMKPAASGVIANVIDFSTLFVDFSAGGSSINSVDSIVMGGTFLSGSRSIYNFSTVHIRGDLLGTSYTGTITNNNGALWVTGEGIVVGEPTGRNKGYGTINVQRDIYKNNTLYNNPDYVFEHWATGQIIKYAGNPGAQDYTGLWDISDLRQYVGQNFRFPQIGDQPAGIFDRAGLFLELVEQAYLYLFQHEDRIQSLEARSLDVFPVALDVTEGDMVVPGDVAVTTTGGDTLSQLVKSSKPYQPSVIGVASKDTKDFPGAGRDIKKENNPRYVTLSGRAQVKVNLENGRIKTGDLITTSSTPGVGMAACAKAMAAEKATCKPGMVVGTALAPFDGAGTGMLWVVLNPHFEDF